MAQPKDKTGQEPVQEAAPVSGGGSSEGESSVKAEVAQLSAQIGAIQTRQMQSMQTFMDWLVERADTTDEDQFAIMASIIDEILHAESPEEVLRERSSLHAKDIIGVPLLVHDFSIRAGSYEASTVSHYAALTCSRAGSEETRIVTCGGLKVLAKLKKLDEFGEWPQVVIFTSTITSNGYDVLDIIKPSI